MLYQAAAFEEDMGKLKMTNKWLLMESKRLIRAELKSKGLLAEPQPTASKVLSLPRILQSPT